ncbi:FHA domain-containing protein [Iningainema tapete]|uniref:FHA domain-containing protein n=1 Tax=Iningainema tapete BLCC-T55 TaxID=2748662 RepID=A0A8J7BVV4_9CYAN|nr:FHA domain-containing protein [Iningainema tapete]MBD2770597.1 FHA domain-containing protein [Iningainema tapete BLCC-T55]
MSELTLEWLEQPIGQIKTQTIKDQQPSIHPGSVRLARDPELCDIILPWDVKVSRLHAEIFFNLEQNSFISAEEQILLKLG